MRVYISVDMEGVAGVVRANQCRRGKDGYRQACEWMTGEANAAALGAFDGGADHVLINDSHGDMQNLMLDAMDPRAEIISGALKPFSMAEGLQGGRYDVALFVGYHGGMGTQASILDHTYRSTVVSEVRVNGRTLNEAGLNGLVAGHAGTPVGLVTGDENTCRQCTELLPSPLDTVTVKWSIGRNSARSLHPAKARELIREAASKVVKTADRFTPFGMDAPYVLEVDVQNSAMADAAALVPGSERPSPRTLRYEAVDVPTLFRAMLTFVKLGGTAL